MGDVNVDQFRMEHESDKEWGLRKKFLLAHHDKFEERRLLCLASCFINVECYGCTYPAGVMVQLKELMGDIMDDVMEHREEVKELMAVKFVKAGESAQSPSKKSGSLESCFVKAGQSSSSADVPRQSEQEDAGSSSKSAFQGSAKDQSLINKFYKMATVIHDLGGMAKNPAVDLFHQAADKCGITITANFNFDQIQRLYHCRVLADFVNVGYGFDQSRKLAKVKAMQGLLRVLEKPYLQIDDVKGLVSFSEPPPDSEASKPVNSRKRAFPDSLSQFLILDNFRQKNCGDMRILNESAAFNKIPIDYDFRDELVGGEHRTRCVVMLGNEVVADVMGTDSKQDMKRSAALKALQSLKQNCWTIRIKQSADSDDTGITPDEVASETDQKVIPESNIGSKLLKKMGWAGGGVGKHGTGIAEPVSMSSVINREGLGLSAQKGIPKNFVEDVRKAIVDYIQSDDQNDMVFSPDFTREERAIIHREAKKFKLKSHSYGKGEERFLALSRKRTTQELFEHVMKEGGETSKYLLIPPSGS